MRLRSLLFVPGDRPERFAKAAQSGADAVILDLEDSVSPEQKDAARGAVAIWLAEPGLRRFVRINPLGSGLAQADLDALQGLSPDGIVLPKAEGAASILGLDAALAARGLSGLPILPIATETPRAMFRLESYADHAPRLAGLTWGAEDLPAALGARTSREADGRYTPPYELARSMLLFAAGAAGVPAIETVYPNFRDLEGLGAYAARGARDGFSGMMAIHPAQVPVINAAFTPDAQSVAHAHAVIAAFQAKPGAGAVPLNGQMLDAPHLRMAERILQQVEGQ